MNSDKSLSVVKSSIVYVGENGAEQVMILLPNMYDNHDLSTFSVRVDLITQGQTGNAHTLTFVASEYQGYLKAYFDIDYILTFNSGRIELWLTMEKVPLIVLKTSSTFIPVNDHEIISDFIPTSQLDLLDGWQNKMDETYTNAQKAVTDATAQANISTEQATISLNSANTAVQKVTEANTSAGNALLSEQNAKASETIILNKVTEAEQHALNSSNSAISAEQQAILAYQYAQQAQDVVTGEIIITDFAIQNSKPMFSQSMFRENIVSGTDTLSIILGKLMKLYYDLQPIAYKSQISKTDIDTAFAFELDGKLNSSVYTAQDILAKLQTVDGLGSGIDSETLNGLFANDFKAYTNTAIAELIDQSPDTLDTLYELSTALGNDPNFATTITNLIATKADGNHTHTDLHTHSNKTLLDSITTDKIRKTTISNLDPIDGEGIDGDIWIKYTP
jgi:hypothetical protein